MRLIDADVLLNHVWDADTRCGYVQVVDRGDIEEAPTVVELIRCRDCRYHVAINKCCHPDGLLCAKDNNFCSYGEKREE